MHFFSCIFGHFRVTLVPDKKSQTFSTADILKRHRRKSTNANYIDNDSAGFGASEHRMIHTYVLNPPLSWRIRHELSPMCSRFVWTSLILTGLESNSKRQRYHFKHLWMMWSISVFHLIHVGLQIRTRKTRCSQRPRAVKGNVINPLLCFSCCETSEWNSWDPACETCWGPRTCRQDHQQTIFTGSPSVGFLGYSRRVSSG